MIFPKFSINLGLEKLSNFKYPNPVIGCSQGTLRKLELEKFRKYQITSHLIGCCQSTLKACICGFQCMRFFMSCQKFEAPEVGPGDLPNRKPNRLL